MNHNNQEQMRFEKILSRSQAEGLALLAEEIWREYYIPLIGEAQVAYMLERFQSADAIMNQLEEGYEYALLHCNDTPAGYLAVVPVPGSETMRLSKIYVKDSCRGKGLGRQLLSYAEKQAGAGGYRKLDLLVNKGNRASVAWYERRGFRRVEDILIDIGGGFVLDDFRMEKKL